MYGGLSTDRIAWLVSTGSLALGNMQQMSYKFRMDLRVCYESGNLWLARVHVGQKWNHDRFLA